MKSLYVFASLLTIIPFSTYAHYDHHDTGLYIGAAIGIADVNGDDDYHYHNDYYHRHHDSANPTLLEVKLGYAFTPFLALEAQLGSELSDDNYNNRGIREEVAIHYFQGIYIKPQVSLRELTLYALLGTASVDIDITRGNQTTTFEEEGVSYGAGFSYQLLEHIGVSTEVKSLPSLSDLDIADVSIGLAFSY